MPNILNVDTASGLEPIDQQAQPALEISAVTVTNVSSSQSRTLRGILDEAESHAILQALQFTGWNRKRAARLLKISYRGLLYKIRRHRITPSVAGD
jgi:transcriptional regulator with PAS, ATPase and Fis domain